jgi:lipoprotein-anchoring transpeptidase ErfK/SrfK
LPGIGWTTLFASGGIAIHSTFWHNNFGVPMSHGCVNSTPVDAKWIFRWVDPPVEYEPGDVTIAMPGGTIVEVIEL